LLFGKISRNDNCCKLLFRNMSRFLFKQLIKVNVVSLKFLYSVALRFGLNLKLGIVFIKSLILRFQALVIITNTIVFFFKFKIYLN
jgi:hypothetical protein